MKRFRFLLLLLVALCGQLVVKAHDYLKPLRGDSMVQGNILDAETKKPISDVTVSLTTSKPQSKKEIKSDASGFFAFPQLPPGEFTLLVEKKGYKPYRKEYMLPKEGGVLIKLSLTEEEDNDGDTWNPLRVLYGK